MNFRKLSLFALLAAASMSSCNNDAELETSNSEYVSSVRVGVEDFHPEVASRTAYAVDASGFHFQWVNGDALGIYAIGGDQLKFPISSGDGSATALFDGGSWKLRANHQYAAYYPYSVYNCLNDQTALPVSYTGQTQDGNGSTAHLGAYDYLACAATSPDAAGGVDLSLKHLGAFLRLQLTMPKADDYNLVSLKSDGAKFVTAGTIDLTAQTPAITPTETSSTSRIHLKNVSTTEPDQLITVYAMVAPANLSSSKITITVYGAEGQMYVQTVDGKAFTAESAYSIAATLTEGGSHEYVDLGLPSGTLWATYNVGAYTPEDYGDYFAWGEVEPKDSYDYSTLFDSVDGSMINFKKYYNNNSGGKTELDLEDDAAYMNWGEGWRMPSMEQIKELSNSNYVKTEWVTQNGKNGRLITSKSNGASLFLPAAGNRYGGSLRSAGSTGYYFSRSLSASDSFYAKDLVFTSTNVGCYQDYRCFGFPVRPVRMSSQN